MAKYRKRPVIIDAEQWVPGENDNILDTVNHTDEHCWIDLDKLEGKLEEAKRRVRSYCLPPRSGLIRTPDGYRIASPGDWIITGVEGGIHLCKDDVFRAVYEEV